jgi:hypothetical protein
MGATSLRISFEASRLSKISSRGEDPMCSLCQLQPRACNGRSLEPESGFLRLRQPFMLALASLLWFSILHADTTWVAGDVYGTWTRDGNPYLVTDTLTIPSGLTLNIHPGVEIWFQDQEIRRTPILVYGRLRAIGAEEDSIYFYSPVVGFGGLDNQGTSDTEIRLIYCVIDSTSETIHSSSGHTMLAHSGSQLHTNES